MFKKKPKEQKTETKSVEKPTPAFLRPDYPYQAIGEPITDMDSLETGVVYEIKCYKCEMSIRSQGQNIKNTWERLKNSGCIGCGNRELVVRRVDMSAATNQGSESV